MTRRSQSRPDRDRARLPGRIIEHVAGGLARAAACAAARRWSGVPRLSGPMSGGGWGMDSEGGATRSDRSARRARPCRSFSAFAWMRHAILRRGCARCRVRQACPCSSSQRFTSSAVVIVSRAASSRRIVSGMAPPQWHGRLARSRPPPAGRVSTLTLASADSSSPSARDAPVSATFSRRTRWARTRPRARMLAISASRSAGVKPSGFRIDTPLGIQWCGRVMAASLVPYAPRARSARSMNRRSNIDCCWARFVLAIRGMVRAQAEARALHPGAGLRETRRDFGPIQPVGAVGPCPPVIAADRTETSPPERHAPQTLPERPHKATTPPGSLRGLVREPRGPRPPRPTVKSCWQDIDRSSTFDRSVRTSRRARPADSSGPFAPETRLRPLVVWSPFGLSSPLSVVGRALTGIERGETGVCRRSLPGVTLPRDPSSCHPPARHQRHVAGSAGCRRVPRRPWPCGMCDGRCHSPRMLPIRDGRRRLLPDDRRPVRVRRFPAPGSAPGPGSAASQDRPRFGHGCSGSAHPGGVRGSSVAATTGPRSKPAEPSRGPDSQRDPGTSGYLANVEPKLSRDSARSYGPC